MNNWKEQCKYVPNGTGTLSKMPSRYPSNYPILLSWGKGGKVYSIDGDEYIDLIAGLGAISVGYCNDEVNKVIEEQLDYGNVFSLPSYLEGLLAKKLTEIIPNTEMWKFGLNGTDANVMAVRTARAYTGRTKIITIGYNGCADVFECQGTRNAGIPEILKEHNTRKTYGFLPIESKEYSCILLEPMVFDYPKDNYLQELKNWCNRNGTLLIFDEIVNGGRFEKFVSSKYFGVEPDLYTIGKGIANGLPLSAVGGKRSIMHTFERSDFFASGTFSTPCVSLAAALETINILEEKIPKMLLNGRRIKEAFNKLPWPKVSEKDTFCIGYPTRLNFEFPTKEHKFLFWQEMCNNGVLIGYTNFVMADHTDEDITAVIKAIFNSFKVLKDNWNDPRSKLKGSIPEAALLRRSN